MYAHSSYSHFEKYRKRGPGLIFVQKTFLVGLCFVGLIFGGAVFTYYYQKVLSAPVVGVTKKRLIQHSKIANLNSPWAYIWEAHLRLRLFFFGGGGKGGLFSGGFNFRRLIIGHYLWCI